MATNAKATESKMPSMGGGSLEEVYRRQRAELDKLIDSRVEPFRKKVKELEARRTEIDEELKHLYTVIGGYEQSLRGGGPA